MKYIIKINVFLFRCFLLWVQEEQFSSKLLDEPLVALNGAIAHAVAFVW